MNNRKMGMKGSKIPAPNLNEDSSTFPYVRGSQEARDRSHKVNYVNTQKDDDIYTHYAVSLGILK